MNVFVDIESTGLCLYKARIIQIGLICGDKTKTILLNPGIDIPSDSTYVHGITNQMVKDCPTFADIATKLQKLIESADCLIGYNIAAYDANILYMEFLRCGIDLKMPNVLDIYNLVRDLEQSKKLKDVYLRYFVERLEGGHDALVDILATKRIYEHILEKFNK